MKQLSIISLLLCLFWGCQDAIEEPASGEAGDLTGQVVQFGGYLPGGIATRAADDYTDYSRMSQAYTLQVTMKQEDGSTLATASYAPKSTDEEANKGLLLPKAGKTPLYWPNSVTACGFTATAGSDVLAADQSEETKWLEQDRLEGYAAVPEAATSEGATTTPSYVVPETAPYMTHKEWYKKNRTWRDDLGLTTADKYKVVPLFMKHQRAWISVILKAGEGVKPEDLAYEKTQTSLTAEIYSYATTAAAEGGEPTTTELKVSPWKRAQEVDYGGTVGEKPSTRLEAIVQPFDYGKAAELPICVLNLSNMKYSFYAKNDSRAKDETQKWKDDYNLTPGKHLVITVTLSNDRKVLITSYLEDWKEVSEEIPSDDYGNQSPPIQIPSVAKLLEFLDSSEKNAAGQMGVITQSLDLSGETWVGSYPLKATLNLAGNTLTLNDKPLLNVMESSATLTNGLIKVKGTVQAAVCLENSGTVDRIRVDEENPAACARQAGLVATNHGFITSCSSNLKVAGDYDEKNPPTAYDGTNMLYIGGIAGVSIPKGEQTTVPTISHCTVTARVDLAKAIKEEVGKKMGSDLVNGKPVTPLTGWKNGRICGGGIVGAATGIVSDNKFEYGITLLTNSYVEGQAVHFRNIVYKEATGFTGRTLRAEGNEWPTNVPNSTTPDPETGTQIPNARATDLLYDGVINSQAELQALVWENSVRNQVGKRYRVAESFTIYSDDTQSENGIGWRLGEKSNILTNAHRGNVLFELDGNDMTITLDGTKEIEYKNSKEGNVLTSDPTAPMLFINITGKIHDLTVHCAKSLYGIPVYNEQTKANELTDVCSPLGYALVGGELNNVKVTAAENVFIQAAVAAGMVCWAKKGATMTNCESSVGVRLRYGKDLPPNALRYGGGLVAQAGRATLTNCRYVSPEKLSGGNLVCINDKNKENPKNNPTGDGTVYIGGIVGGTVVESSEAAGAELPHLVMKDCSSWYAEGLEKVSNGTTTKGSIIGCSNYAQSANVMEQGVHDCEGNWWPIGWAGVGTWTQGESLTEEKVIGRRNGVIPAKPTTVNQ